MGAGASAAQTPAAGDHDIAVGLDPAVPDPQSPARRQGLDLGATLARTVSHFFPDLFQWLGEVGDKCDQDAITYGRRFLTWMGLMLFLLKLGSRRRLRFELDTPEALANLNALSRAEQETMAHSDTLNYFGNEGFNLQKNGGFNLEHACSIGSLQIKNFYVLLHPGAPGLQLVERGSLLTRQAKQIFGSLANLARRLAESIPNVLIAANATDPTRTAKMQIRLNTS